MKTRNPMPGLTLKTRVKAGRLAANRCEAIRKAS